MTTALRFRIFHQFRTEWRHHYGWIIAWVVWLLLQYSYRTQSLDSASYASSFMVEDLVPLTTLLLAATIAWRCVSSDSPSNTDSVSLTRPIGQTALWLGKLAFLASNLVLPLLLVEVPLWSGYGHGSLAWLALCTMVLLAAVVVLGITGAATALTSSTAQVIAIAVLGVLGAGLSLTLGLTYVEIISPAVPQSAPLAQGARACGGIIAAFIAAFGTMAAWWLATVPRRRRWAAALLLLSLLQAPLLASSWQYDWITPPPQFYPKAKLGIKTGKTDPDDKAPGRPLWPTLRITGLGKDEVASIIDFAPVLDGAKEQVWPPLGSYSDLVRNINSQEAWLNLDHLRAILKHYPATTLWQHSLTHQTMYSGRHKIQDVIKPLRLDPQAMPARWRLRLAVHEMRRVTTLPCSQLWNQGGIATLLPGLRVEFHPAEPWFGSWQIRGRLHHLYPRLLRPQKHSPAIAQGAPLSPAVLLVFEDPEFRENGAYTVGLQHSVKPPALHVDLSRGFSLILPPQATQHFFLKTTQDDWARRNNVSIWLAEERGTIDLELTALELQQALDLK